MVGTLWSKMLTSQPQNERQKWEGPGFCNPCGENSLSDLKLSHTSSSERFHDHPIAPTQGASLYHSLMSFSAHTIRLSLFQSGGEVFLCLPPLAHPCFSVSAHPPILQPEVSFTSAYFLLFPYRLPPSHASHLHTIHPPPAPSSTRVFPQVLSF